MRHKWESRSLWGIIVGVSKCKVCGIRSMRDNLDSECLGKAEA